MKTILPLALALMMPAVMAEARWFPPSPPPAEEMVIVDLWDATPETKLTMTSLQGIVNQGDATRLYVLMNEHDFFWLNELEKNEHVQDARRIDVHGAMVQFRDELSGAVIIDPDVPASINVATMMASIEKRVVVDPAEMVHAEGITDIVDLRGRWSTNVEAQEWAFEHLRPHLNPSVLACYHPTSIPHHMRDYFVQQGVFVFWITSVEKEDGIVSDHAAERAFAEKLFAASPPNTPVLGFWYSGADHGIQEYTGVKLAGEYGMITVPCDWGSNTSVHSGIRVDVQSEARQWRERIDSTPKPSLDDSKVYLALDILDSGDAPHYWMTNQYKVFQDPARGSVPINWSLGVATAELYPAVLSWHYRESTTADTFFCGLSGLGYMFPYLGYASRRVDPDRVWADFFFMTNRAMQELQLNAIVLYTDSWKPFPRDLYDPMTLRTIENVPAAKMLVLGMGRDGESNPEPNYLLGDRDVLVSHAMTRWDPGNVGRNEENIKWLADEIRSQTPESRPAFLHVQCLSWSYHPSDLRAVMDLLGEEYQAVTLDDFGELWMAAKGE
jgi:hypothetical protein